MNLFRRKGSGLSASGIRFPGKVWRLLADPWRSQLVVEVREAQWAGYFWLPLEGRIPREVKKTDLMIPAEGPEMAMAFFVGGLLMLQGYQEMGLPVHKGVFAYAVPEGTLKWSEPALRFKGLSEEGVVLESVNPFEGRLEIRDFESGEVLKRESELDAVVVDQQVATFAEKGQDAYGWPERYLAETETFSELKKEWGLESAVIQIEQLEYEGFRLLAWVERGEAGKGFRQHLLVSAGSPDQIVWEDLILDNVETISRDSFFRFHDTILYVKGSHELCLWVHPESQRRRKGR